MRLVDVITRRVLDILVGTQKSGVVTGTSGTKVIVTVDGASMTLPRLASYTPVTNGDVVEILALRSGSWLVLGKPA